MLSYFNYEPKRDWMTKTKEEILKEQQFNLKNYLHYVYTNSPYYRQIWNNIGITSGDEAFLKFKELPLLNQYSIIGKNSYSLISTSKENIKYEFCSGGTTGNPKLLFYAKKDWENRAIYRSRFGQIRNIGRNDIVQLMIPYGIWNVGYSAQSALEILGTTILPTGCWMSGLESILGLMTKMKATVLMSTPSLAMRIANKHPDIIKDNNLRMIITTGEDISIGLRKEIEKLWNAEVSATYASSEAVIGVECKEHNGYHFWADKLLIEVMDKNGIIKTEGEGEILITPLFGEAMPLIKYRLGDYVKITWEKCKCGLEYPRIFFQGRIKNTFVLPSGINVFHFQIKNVLESLPFPAFSYRIILEDGVDFKDKVTIQLETNETDIESKKIAENMFLQTSIDFEDGVSQNYMDFQVEFVSPEKFMTIETSKKQLLFIIDKRKFKL